ncbi:MAG: EcsC family protein, partial [Cyanobacteria bacterium J06639_1]
EGVIQSSKPSVQSYVNQMSERHPQLTKDELAKRIVSRKSLKNGLVGAVTGVGGLITLPVTVPANIAGTWRVQIIMAMAIARLYECEVDKTDIYLILAGNSAKETLKRLGVEVGKHVTRKAVNRYITREVMKKIWALMGRKIITKAGEKSLVSFTKMILLIGAPIGFGFDWTATQAVGRTAIRYYR